MQYLLCVVTYITVCNFSNLSLGTFVHPCSYPLHPGEILSSASHYPLQSQQIVCQKLGCSQGVRHLSFCHRGSNLAAFTFVNTSLLTLFGLFGKVVDLVKIVESERGYLGNFADEAPIYPHSYNTPKLH